MTYLTAHNLRAKSSHEYIKFGAISWKIDFLVNDRSLKFKSKNLFGRKSTYTVFDVKYILF